MVNLIGAIKKTLKGKEDIICSIILYLASSWLLIVGTLAVFFIIFRGFMGHSLIEWVNFLIVFLGGGYYIMFITFRMSDNSTKEAIINAFIMMFLSFGIACMSWFIVMGCFRW